MCVSVCVMRVGLWFVGCRKGRWKEKNEEECEEEEEESERVGNRETTSGWLK